MSNPPNAYTFVSCESFYLDAGLTGHCLLEPSIYAYQGLKGVFSPLDTDSDPFLQVLVRLILGVALVIIGGLSLLLVPVGLIIKLIGSQCCPPPAPTLIPRTPTPTESEIDEDSSSTTDTDSSSDDEQLPAKEERPTNRGRSNSLPPETNKTEGQDNNRRAKTPPLSGRHFTPLTPIPQPIVEHRGDPSQAPDSALPPLESPPPSPIIAHENPIGEKKTDLGKEKEVEKPSRKKGKARRVRKGDESELPSSVPEILKRARGMLARINPRQVDPKLLEAVQLELDEKTNPCLAVLKRHEPTKDMPRNEMEAAVLEYTNLLLWCDSLEHSYAVWGTCLEQNGEIRIRDDGDCLFQVFAFGQDSSPDIERAKAVAYIRENYKTDPLLQQKLLNSLSEHYYSELERLQSDLSGMEGVSHVEEDPMASIIRISQIEQEIEHLMLSKIEPINRAMPPKIEGAVPDHRGIQFDKVAHLVEPYLDEMSKPQIYGGAAELYALSHLHKACVHVYRKERDIIADAPHEIVNDQYKDKVIKVTHTRNHFNRYTPELLV